jgi:hypothetical protein
MLRFATTTLDVYRHQLRGLAEQLRDCLDDVYREARSRRAPRHNPRDTTRVLLTGHYSNLPDLRFRGGNS